MCCDFFRPLWAGQEVIIMKTETVVKVLRRYVKGLQAMENEAVMESSGDAKQYRFDKIALEQALEMLEGKE